MKRVLVTGATGFVGYEVARHLSTLGLRPRLMVSRALRSGLLKSLEADVVIADLADSARVAAAVEDVDAVIHLAARATFERYELLRPSIVDGSRNLMEAATRAGVTTFVYAGSLLVYGAQKELVTQSTPSAPRIGYARAKLEAEHVLQESAIVAGMGFCSVRLPHVYGVNSLLFDEIRRGRVIFPGAGWNRFSHLHVFDAARVLVNAVMAGKDGIYPVADDAPCSWNDLLSIIKQYLPRLRVIHIPEGPALVATGLLDLLSRLSDRVNIYSQDAVESWNMTCAVAPGTLREYFSIEPAFPCVAKGVPAVLDECVSLLRLMERTGARQ